MSMSANTANAPGGGPSFAKTIWQDFGMVVILAILVLFCCLFVPNFATTFNMTSLSLAVSMTGMVSCTMMLVLASGNFDMSCGAVIACTGVVCAKIMQLTSASLGTGSVYLAVAVALCVGLIVGVINGLTIAYSGINALITTLATMQITRGVGYIIGDGRAVGISREEFFSLGAGSTFGIPNPVYITVACFIVFGVILERMAFGRNTLAIGGNGEAAYLSGIRVRKHKMLLFVIHGAVSSFAGVVLASRMTSGQPMTSMGFELDVISACVLGGISMAGGVASVWFVLSGVLIMGIVQNAMNLLNVPTFYQYVARGVILLLAVIFDRYKQRR